MKKDALVLLVLIGIFIIVLKVFLVTAVTVNESDNSSICQNMTLYLDNDLDLYGSLNSTIMCINSTIPSGYSNNSNDCNDNDSNVWKTIIGYQDRDGDGFGDNNPIGFCAKTLPLNYVNVSGDCADFNQLIHPNATEICNGVDDNCNGMIDEIFLDKGNSCSVGIGECQSSGVMICNKNGNGTMCHATAKAPTIEICDLKDNDCDGLIDENDICNNTNISFIINQPLNGTFNKNNIPINLSLFSNYGKKVDKMSYFDYSMTKPKEILLCKNCKDYGFYISKTINLKDGLHNLLFRAIINGTELNNSVSVLIDSKNPRLYLPRIRTKDYTNGSFSINYDEDNLKSIILFYDNQNYTEYNCSSGKNKFCKIFVNLSDYDGLDIQYSYLVQDIAGNKAVTKNMTAEVDITPPYINNISYPVNGSYVFFMLNITEKNFKDVSYFDNSYDKAKWKLLCSVLKDGICNKQVRLSPGEHNLTVKIEDLALNSVSVNL